MNWLQAGCRLMMKVNHDQRKRTERESDTTPIHCHDNCRVYLLSHHLFPFILSDSHFPTFCREVICSQDDRPKWYVTWKGYDGEKSEKEVAHVLTTVSATSVPVSSNSCYVTQPWWLLFNGAWQTSTTIEQFSNNQEGWLFVYLLWHKSNEPTIWKRII